MATLPHVSLSPEPVFHLGDVVVTNSLVNAVGATVVLILIACFLSLVRRLIPGRFQSLVESLMETLLGYFDRVTGSRERSRRLLPFAGSVFLFILLSNWMGLLPGIGSIGVWHGEEFVPLFRPAMSDLNLTLAMALLAVLLSHTMGISEQGIWSHINKFFNVAGIFKAFKTGKVMKILTAFVEFCVGLLELVGELAKVASLSLRLFGNIFAGEVLMTVMASLFAFLLPLPFMALEGIVGLVQASVFTMLTVVYISVLIRPAHAAEH